MRYVPMGSRLDVKKILRGASVAVGSDVGLGVVVGVGDSRDTAGDDVGLGCTPSPPPLHAAKESDTSVNSPTM
jgi:hypothetical protein